MFRIRSMSTRLVLAISATTFGASLLFGAFSMVEQRDAAEAALDQQLELQYKSVLAALDYEGRTARAVGTVIAGLPPVQEALKNDDRDALGALLLPGFAALKAANVPLFTFTKPPAMSVYRVHAPEAFGDDVSGRRKTVVLANSEHRQVSGVEPGRDNLSIFGLVPIAKDGKHIGVIDVGIPFGKPFVDSVKARYGIDVAVHRLDGKEFSVLATTMDGTTTATPDELKRVIAGTPIRRAATVAGHSAAIYLAAIKNFAGEPVAVLELAKDTSAFDAAAATAQRKLLLGMLAMLVGAVAVALFVGRSMSRPVLALTATMNHLSGGDTATVIAGLARKDELGRMAEAVQVFKDNMLETARLRGEQEAMKARAGEERHNAMLSLAERFEQAIGGIVGTVASSATEMQSTAQGMSGIAGEARRRATAVAAAAAEATANVQTVAAAAEELTASIGEIGQRVNRSAEIASGAAEQAQKTNVTVANLAAGAAKIGEVVQLIQDIASQTNLLALNATIEAARAGEAGKGFAVVASEVKSLANQTAKATDDIRAQIAGIQGTTGEAVTAIQAIATTIQEVNEIAASIAAAVTEQGAATQEIARNVQQAATGTNEVSANIDGVNRASAEVGDAAGQVLASAGALSEQGERLRREVATFLATVRAA
jgi:methyl-accepting chemotaxis protein